MNTGGRYFKVGKKRIAEADLTEADRKQIEKQRSEALNPPAPKAKVKVKAAAEVGADSPKDSPE